MLDAVVFGQDAYKDVLNLIIELAEEEVKDPWELTDIDTSKEDELVSKNLQIKFHLYTK